MTFSIQYPTTESDVAIAYNFANNILQFSKDYPRSLSFYISVFNKDPRYILIAKHRNNIVGTILSSDQDENSLLVGEIAISDGFRGLGLGSRLMNKIEENAKLLNKTQILLGALNTAEDFYLKRGYIPKLFIQLEGNNRIEEIKKHISNRIIWDKTGDGFSKVIVATEGIDKDLQNKLSKALGAHTQYLFSKDLA